VICNYEKAQEYFLESLNTAEEMNDKKNVSFALNNIGILFFRLKQYDKALEYYERALQLKLEHAEKASVSTAYNNIGLVYNNLKEFDKALLYFRKSMKIDKNTGNMHALCRVLNNIGLTWKHKNDRKKSLQYFKESYDISREAGYNKGMASSLSNISTHYLEEGQFDLALEKGLEGEKLSIAIHSNNHLLNFYGQIAEAYEKKKNFELALNYYKKHFVLKDQIFSEESHNRIFEMQIRYETEKKEKESEIYRLRNEELSVLNSTKDKFFRIIHHDLLSPFTAIHATAGFLDKFYDKFDDGKRKSYLKMILGSSERLLKLMDNLFEWVKTQSGEIDFKPEETDIRNIVETNMQLLGNNINSKEIETDVKIPAGCRANSDRNMIDTIVRNLIANAIKFTPEKGKITISAKSFKNKVRLSVEDNGIGISRSNLKKLFKVSEVFTTPGTNDEKGTGLGLILVKEFLDICGGNIFVSSQPDKGTKFTIELPRYN
jgi:signal transduction histidine kinase